MSRDPSSRLLLSPFVELPLSQLSYQKNRKMTIHPHSLHIDWPLARPEQNETLHPSISFILL